MARPFVNGTFKLGTNLRSFFRDGHHGHDSQVKPSYYKDRTNIVNFL